MTDHIMQKEVSKSYRTTALILLTLVYTLSFIDRQIIGTLSPFIQEDLGLNDSQLGWLKGFAFALLYTAVGIPIAWLADRYNRVRIVSISLALWSAFTALTGLANSFASILAARIGVGIGEAGGSPPSHSIISDMYPKEKRASALGIYSLGIPFGIMFAYFAAGQLATTLGWRGTLIALGVPGVILALIVMAFIKEPVRGATDHTNADLEPTSVLDSIITLAKIPSWWAICLGAAFVSYGGYSVANWNVDYLIRFDPSLKTAERFRWLLNWLGVLNGIAFGLGTYFGALLVEKLAKKNVNAYGWAPACALLIGAPCLMASYWVDSVNMHLILISVYLVASGVYLGPSFSVAQTLAPIRMRAMSTAMFFLILNLIALGGGPTITGIISNALTPQYGATHGLRLALTLLSITYVLAIISFFVAGRTLPKDWAEAEARNQSA